MWNHQSSSKSKGSSNWAKEGQGCGGGVGLKNDVDVIDKVEKHLDLTNYLNFLQNLFSLSTSDSENSDVEGVDSLLAVDLNNPPAHPLGIPPPSSSHIGLGPGMSMSMSSTKVKIALKSSSASSPFISDHPVPSTLSRLPAASLLPNRKSGTSTKSQSSSSVDSSSNSTSTSTNSSSYGEDTSFLPSDLTPMSDLELNNLLKRTNYLGSDVEVEVDPMTFDMDEHDHDHETAKVDADADAKKKKKKKSKKKKGTGTSSSEEMPRQNRPNSGGRGNGHGPSHGSASNFGGFNGSVSDTSGNSSSRSSRGSSNNAGNKSRSCGGGGSGGAQHQLKSGSVGGAAAGSSGKQSLRKKENSNSTFSAVTATATAPGGGAAMKKLLSSSSAITNSASTSAADISATAKTNSTASLKTKSLAGLTVTGNGKRVKNPPPSKLNANNDISKLGANNFSSSSGLQLQPFEFDHDSDDNDSLSDYLSMAATAASTTTGHDSPFPHENLQPVSNSVGRFMQGDDEMVMVTVSDEDEDDHSPSSLSLGSGSKSDESGSGPLGSSKRGMKRKRGELSQGKKDSAKNKKLLLQKRAKYIELMNLTRKKIYVGISKKEVPKAQRTTFTTHKEMLAVKRRLAQACSKAVRQKAIQSQKITKESVWRAKRLTREMQAFWRQADRVEKENKKRLEKEEEEQRKQDVEALEVKRHQQNLNFLITETELYAHLITKNIHDGNNIVGHDNSQAQTILERLKGQCLENHEVESQKIKVKINVQEALEAQKIHTKLFHVDSKPIVASGVDGDDRLPPEEADRGIPLFSGNLKNYQVLGVNWLTKLFDNGIDGVLADEVGLGKTVQAIAFLAHLAENSGIWGPFLVIAPASSCHYWQQEITRFVSKFKIIPYWGSPQERKILRQFWSQTNLHTSEASFHVVVTSYNVVVQDLKYFNKVKWQYLILDEAQAIKTTVSTRWKALIGFNCRNRLLLLNGVPVQNQNSINELLSLLHFIMPSLFFSQEDFSEWLSKDVESQSNDNLARLYTVLQQFLLRRTKKDVESELCDKIELLVPCPLTTRQRFFHAALVRKIIAEDLLKLTNSSGSSSSSPSNTSSPQHDARNLLSLVMQFRKVCNHPDLFERRDMKSPFFMGKILYALPKLLFQDKLNPDSASNYLYRDRFNIFNPTNIHYNSIVHQNGFSNAANSGSISQRGKIEDIHIANLEGTENLWDAWSFLRFCGIAASDIYKVACGTIAERIMQLVKSRREKCLIRHHALWRESTHSGSSKGSELAYDSVVEIASENLKNLVFTSYTEPFYKWNDNASELLDVNNVEQKSVIMIPNDTCTREPGDLMPLHVPKFMFNLGPKVRSSGLTPHVVDGSVSKWIQRTGRFSDEELSLIMHGHLEGLPRTFFTPRDLIGLLDLGNVLGWSGIVIPDKEKLVTDSGKMMVLDGLLKNLKLHGHRVVIYSLLPKMTDLLEEYFRHRKYTYVRADGFKSQTDFQVKSDTFAILLNTTTRAAFMGYDFSEMDTIIFYDCDSTTIDQQTVDLADRLGQTGHTKQVTVYKLFCKGTLEERLLRKIRHKSEPKSIPVFGTQQQQLGSEALTPREILSLLLDDEELDRKYRQRQADKKVGERISDRKQPSTTSHQSSQSIGASASTSNQPSEGENIVNGNAAGHIAVSSGSCQSQESSPSSQDESDEMDPDMKELEFDVTCVYDEDISDMNPSTSDYFDNYSRAIEWNNGSTSDYEEDLPFIPKKPKHGRGTGKRGRPPSRVRVQMRDLSSVGVGGDLSMRRGPGRPRLKPIGPLNQGIRGRRPGRPPLSKKAETISTSLSPLTPTQRVFGMYNSQDLNMSS